MIRLNNLFLFIICLLFVVTSAEAQNKPVFKAKDKVTATVRPMGENGPPELAYDNISYQLIGDFLEDSTTYLLKTVKHFNHYNTFMEGGTKCDSVTLVFYPNCSEKYAFEHTAKGDEFYFESYHKYNYLIALSHGCCAEPTRGTLSTLKENRPFLKFENTFFEINSYKDVYYVGIVNHCPYRDTVSDLMHVATIYYSHNQQPADSIVVKLRRESNKEYYCLDSYLKQGKQTECFGEDPHLCRRDISSTPYCKYDGLLFYKDFEAEVEGKGILISIGLQQEIPKELIIQ